MKDLWHVEMTQLKWQGFVAVPAEMAPDLFAAQHAYTQACDGFHEPGQCPQTEVPE